MGLGRRPKERLVMNRYSLIACDIDGTLLRSNGAVSSRTMRALRLAEQSGAWVALATGRRIASTTPVARELCLDAPCIAHCGAVVYDPSDESVLTARQIPRQAALRACLLASGIGADVAVHESVHLGRSIFVTTPAELTDATEHWPYMAPYYKLAGDFEEACRDDAVQLCITADTAAIHRLLQLLACEMPGVLSTVDYGIVENGKHMVDVFAHGVDKALGVSFVAQLCGVAQSEVVGIGDSANDIELIRYAGLGVAMGNAPQEIRGLARTVAPSNDEDGVASVIEDLAARGSLGRGAGSQSCARQANARRR